MLYRQVHRFQLIRDQSAFESMFSCPTVTPPDELEGNSDDNPIQLQGDSVEEVRALIGYLYSLCVCPFIRSMAYILTVFVCRPHEVQTDLTDGNDFDNCCRLARIAHKYHFNSIEKWALNIIKTFWISRDVGTSIPRILQTTQLASLCQHADLVGIVTESWIKVVKTGNVSEIGLAIRIAEQYGLPTVKGRAYYAMMILGRNVWEKNGVLMVSQRLRLLSGFHDLVQLCNRLEKQEPPEIIHMALCTSTTPPAPPSPLAAGCKSGWIHLWKMMLTDPEVRDLFLSLSPADYIGRLSCIAANLRPFNDKMLTSTGWKMADECRQRALDRIHAMSEECTRSLPDMFVDLKLSVCAFYTSLYHS